LMDFLEDYPDPVANVARAVLSAELGKLHLQNPRHIKEEIKQIVEREAQKPEVERDVPE
jgi:hypothetical protein